MKNAITILDHLQFDCPTPEQKSALLSLSAFVKKDNLDDFYILCGAAGTGKTSMTTALIGYLNSIDTSYNIAAPTGRAARILGRKSKTINSTIHSLIYNPKTNSKTGEVIFTLKNNDVKDFNIYIIDEASMISTKVNLDNNNLFKTKNSLLSDLIHFVKSGNKNNKIIFLGDRNQLPPVHEKESLALSETYLKNKYNLKGQSKLLSKVKRQDDGSYILKNANKLRVAIEQNRKIINLEGIQKKSVHSTVKDYLSKFMKNGLNTTISIGCTHKMNMMFNDEVRSQIYGLSKKILQKNDYLLITKTWQRNNYQLFSGDHIAIKEVNLSDIEIVSGLSFVPVKILSKNIEDKKEEFDDYLLLDSLLNPQGIPMKLESQLRHERFKKNKIFRETLFPWNDRYVGAIRATYGHSITCNKAQGGEWDHVFINSYFMPSLRWQYTSITRGKNDVNFY